MTFSKKFLVFLMIPIFLLFAVPIYAASGQAPTNKSVTAPAKAATVTPAKTAPAIAAPAAKVVVPAKTVPVITAPAAKVVVPAKTAPAIAAPAAKTAIPPKDAEKPKPVAEKPKKPNPGDVHMSYDGPYRGPTSGFTIIKELPPLDTGWQARPPSSSSKDTGRQASPPSSTLQQLWQKELAKLPVCPKGQYRDFITGNCLCTGGKLKDGNQCLDRCPDGKIISNDQKSCWDVCKVGQNNNQSTGVCECPNDKVTSLKDPAECWNQCPGDQTNNRESGVCECRYNKVLSSDGSQCWEGCATSIDANGTIGECVCTGNNKMRATDGSQACWNKCPEGQVNNPGSGVCECKDHKVLSPDRSKCWERCAVDMGSDLSVGECICTEGTIRAPDNSQACWNNCPEGQINDLGSGACQCSDRSKVKSGDGNQCLDGCPADSGQHADSSGQCKCVQPAVMSSDGNGCLSGCPQGEIEVAGRCKTLEDACAPGGGGSGSVCMRHCTATVQPYWDETQKKCVHCAEGSYWDGTSCLSQDQYCLTHGRCEKPGQPNLCTDGGVPRCWGCTCPANYFGCDYINGSSYPTCDLPPRQ